MRRGELWWADLGAHRAQEQTGRRPVVIWQSDALNRALQSVLVVPLTTKRGTRKTRRDRHDRCYRRRAAKRLRCARVSDAGEIPKLALVTRIRALTETELAELELATDEALGRLEPE